MIQTTQYIGYLVRLLALYHFISLISFSRAEARTCHYKWEVNYEYKSPDCYKKLAITINGRTPGPTIMAQQGDIIIVELKNNLLTEDVAIRWHGIRQTGTCIYHGHYEMQREAGLYRSIIVLLPNGVSENFSCDYDGTIVLNDWYLKNTNEQTSSLSSIPFIFVGEPQSLLINGRGKYNCSLLTAPISEVEQLPNATNPDCSPYVLTVVPGKTYPLRIGRLAALSALSFEIAFIFYRLWRNQRLNQAIVFRGKYI